MAQFRPAGFSDEDSDSDDYGFYEKPVIYIIALHFDFLLFIK